MIVLQCPKQRSGIMDGSMSKSVLAIAILAAVCFCSCKAPEEGHMQAVLGAVLIDGAGGPPVSNSIVITSGGRIRAAGTLSVGADPRRGRQDQRLRQVSHSRAARPQSRVPNSCAPSTPEQARTAGGRHDLPGNLR